MRWESIKGWFGWPTYYDKLVKYAPKGADLVEVGVYAGQSLMYLHERCVAEGRTDLNLIGVDSFERDDVNADAVIDTFDRIEQCIEIVVAPSLIAVEHSVGLNIWSVFIDAGHDYEDISADIAAWSKVIIPGGYIGGHDYPQFPGVKKAVDEVYPDCLKIPKEQVWYQEI